MIFWDRVVLKERAKMLLRRTYWMSFLVAFITGIFGAGSSGGAENILWQYKIRTGALFNYSGNDYSFRPLLASGVVFFALFAVVFAVAFWLLVANMATLGQVRYFSAVRYGNASISEIFYGYKNGYFWKNVTTMFMRGLFTFLWSLLFLIPGIIKSYSYFMVPYIIAENPNIGWERAMDISKRTTNGEKWEMFVLDLSFLGWILLTVLTCGIGVPFLNPYILATKAELYGALRYKAVQQGICDRSEIGSEL